MRGGVVTPPYTQQHHDPLIPHVPWALLFFVIFLRVLVGFQPHSGQNNHHGSKVAYGGDYEAQRHWMELTWSLPSIGDWYYYDLEYWGLDYPPLTAYISWLCGWASSALLGPHTVALDSSRGLEDATHKAFMRATVLVLDIAIYMTAVWYSSYTRFLIQDFSQSLHLGRRRLWLCCFALAQPAIILIDHGHFQYNTVALGLALWSFHFMTLPGFTNCIVGSIFFCLALNFKQMTLYYAPAVFFYLLGRCCASNGGDRTSYTDSGKKASREGMEFLLRFAALGTTVISTFALMWWPFLYYSPTMSISTSSSLYVASSTPWTRLRHVLHRLFPFQRGLFEGKVSNLWCALSIKPFSIRQRLPSNLQPLLATVLTLCLVMPAVYRLFHLGRLSQRTHDTKDSMNNQLQHLKLLLWGSACTGLAFFLASFQVHEKSILMPLAPLSLLWHDDETLLEWFSLLAVWTMWPLLMIDQLQVAYVCLILIFVMLIVLHRTHNHGTVVGIEDPVSATVIPKRLAWWWVKNAFVAKSYCIMLGLHILEIFVTPPHTLPDLFPVLWSLVGCFFFCCAWCATVWHLWQPPPQKEFQEQHAKSE